MALLNHTAREITGKIVYYGPGLCGKTTNLEFIYEKLDPRSRERMVTLETEGERTLFFDFLPISAGKIGELNLRYQLLTVPGQVYYNASRRLVLKKVDGVIFVADSDPNRLEANIEALQNLYDNLRDIGIDPDAVPLVLQYNKRDLPGALPVDFLQEALNYDDVPAFEAVAMTGDNVLETLAEAMRLVRDKLRREFLPSA
jgi:signal recognition particle receptor subunit beta